MKLTKLCTLALLGTLSTSVFAATPQIVNDIVNDFSTRANNVVRNGNEIRNYNQQLVITASSEYNSGKALVQLTPFLAWWSNNLMGNAVAMQKALKAGDYAQATQLSKDYQRLRREMYANTSINSAAYAALLADATLLAKTNKKVDAKNKTALAEYYSSIQYFAYTTPATIMNVYEFVGKDMPKHIHAGLDSVTQASCEANVSEFRNKFNGAKENNPDLATLQQIVAPGSLFRNVLAASGSQQKFVGDALDVFYVYTTGMAANKSKSKPYNVCDYAQFKAISSSNMYASLMNKNIETVLAQSGSRISAEKVFWTLTSASALSLNRTLLADKVSGSANSFVNR